MREPDGRQATSTAAGRPPVVSTSGDDLDDLRYGAYVTVGRDQAAPIAAGAGAAAVLGLGTWGWVEFGRDDAVVGFVLAVVMMIAAGVLLMATRYRTPRLGIQLNPTHAMVGNWPRRTYQFPRTAITRVTLSEHPWDGETRGAVPDHDFRRAGRHFVEIAVRSGEVFCVAVDNHNNPVHDHIMRELGLEQRATVEATVHDSPTRPAPTSDEKLWEAAQRTHDELLLAYLPYETEPMTVMRYPALSDITHPATARFHESLGEANALRTDTMPTDPAFAAAYRDAVRRLAVDWATAERSAKREGTSYLDPSDRRKLDLAAKLLRHAEGTAEPTERAAYLRQMKAIMDELVDTGALYAPPRIVAAIDAAATRAIEAAERYRAENPGHRDARDVPGSSDGGAVE
ncbi:hypothetical protein [Gordonia hydrophobica]|uniref:Uncharacterized protein n=1 Tax=Gordonia hydrophobica TaxID=40516 RepID=A0ABZ2U0I2_9ACTN|nr:hypothetical protein [Gordonia hydrophobica]MBM7367733.1 hypothetical protein [Gordonia hydrophobica]